MKTKHTPGPWTAELEANDMSMNGIGIYTIQGLKGTVCNCEESTIEETEANAQMISAAPDLLACVQELIKFCPILDDDTAPQEYIRALAAIAKATGGAE